MDPQDNNNQASTSTKPILDEATAKKIAEDFLAMQKATKTDLDNLTKEPTESFSDVVEEFEEQQNDFQAMYDAGGDFSKKLSEIAHKGGRVEERESTSGRTEKTQEIVEEVPIAPEIEKSPDLTGYIEQVEKAAETQQVVADDYTQQILLKPTSNQSAKVVLPLTEDQVQVALHMKIWNSIRWLAEWCVRQIKLLKGRGEYKKQG